MFIATVVVSVLVALAALGSGMGKLSKNPKAIEPLHDVGVPASWPPVLGSLEVAGGLGVLVGLWWAPLGVAAATGLTLYFLGAIVAHVRVKDPKFQPAAALFVLSAAALVLRIVTM